MNKLFEINVEKLAASGIPSHMHGAVTRYFENGIPPGNFLTAVLNNDLKEACSRADDMNQAALFEYVKFFYNNVPAGSWGHENAVENWIAKAQS